MSMNTISADLTAYESRDLAVWERGGFRPEVQADRIEIS